MTSLIHTTTRRTHTKRTLSSPNTILSPKRNTTSIRSVLPTIVVHLGRTKREKCENTKYKKE
jgi:hypothetical protein